ncbi:MAG: hypothetical protein QME21_14085 [Anaerolineales bacterium]|jgi:hypothetical protein|nr:hypothetical protein [Anaerolineales bacterium]
MQLIILLVIAGVVGYYLARSKYSKSIDEATSKISASSRSAADKIEDWWRGMFAKNKPPQSEVIEGQATDVSDEPAPPAEKQPSRRRESSSSETTE